MTVQRNQAFLSLFQAGAEHRDAALAYASYQIFVFPLAPGTKDQPVVKAWQHKATISYDQIRRWWPEGSDRNIGIYLVPSCIVVIDVDPRNNGDDTLAQLINDHGQLPTTYTVRTGGDGRHFYFRVPADFYSSGVTYPTKLGDGVELLVNKYVVAPPSELDNGKQYAITSGSVEHDFTPLPFDWVEEVIHARALEHKSTFHQDNEQWSFPVGTRNDGMAQVAGYLRRAWFSTEEIEDTLNILGRNGRFEPFDDEAIHATHSVARSIGRNRPGEIKLTETTLIKRTRGYKPSIDLASPAFMGPLGDFVRFIDPITEAHPAAILGQSLVVFGNMIGARDKDDPGPGFTVEDAHHKTALYVMIVGQSAQAAKGDSWGRVHNLFKRLDADWRVHSGIQTGEAIISSMADEEPTGDVALINGKPVDHTRKGANDKRYLVYEPEFVRVLHVAQRQGAIIKDILRTMWDTGETESIAKSSQQRVTNGTLSIIGHITKADLERELPDVDLINGFGNRFLYVHSERTKFLPSAVSISSRDLKTLLDPFRDALEFAQEAPIDYKFTKPAAEMWEALGRKWYNEAKKLVPAIEDQLSGRARPLVRRMAVIYAIADCSPVIEIEHLEAAHTFWKYCFESVIYIFGNRIGDKDADKLYRALVEYAPGLTISEIHSMVFKNNKSKAQIARIIGILTESGRIRQIKVKQNRKTVDVFQVIHESYQGET